jgi:hypothetical protein
MRPYQSAATVDGFARQFHLVGSQIATRQSKADQPPAVNIRKLILTIGAGVLIALALLVHLQLKSAQARSQVTVRAAGAACDAYLKFYQEPPTSMADLVHNRSNIVFVVWSKAAPVDGWGRPINFTPFDPARGYGSVTSYGRDGRPGGKGLDADVEARFGEMRK